MYFFDFDDLAGEPEPAVIGASPELHVRLEGRKATVRPIAGTRPRGKTPPKIWSWSATCWPTPRSWPST
jgi:anthranilate/para-aminobenzoate synthase component I